LPQILTFFTVYFVFKIFNLSRRLKIQLR